MNEAGGNRSGAKIASPLHRGEEIRGSASTKAERVAEEELRALRWSAVDLRGRRNNDPQKVRIAMRLRHETITTLEWIAQRLCMGAATHVASFLQCQASKQQTSEKTLF